MEETATRYFDNSWKRTMYCGEVSGRPGESPAVVLNGWVRKRRDLGGLIFLEIWDHTGTVQVVFNPELTPEAHERAGELRSEYVIAVRGRIQSRPEGTVNPSMKTGEWEVAASDLLV
ncbi:MAG TPA: Asp-tRNA(Asn)/Glu-tRNA(Gln) amidotransferase GatCAB subunit C, partial [Synergistaceae bacterium]|nr:Asp-tRNA(Asn)/Glu-tRNA(Gln) amidotransferase GatCAB subunit C [Synergistaceae bacterium]